MACTKPLAYGPSLAQRWREDEFEVLTTVIVRTVDYWYIETGVVEGGGIHGVACRKRLCACASLKAAGTTAACES